MKTVQTIVLITGSALSASAFFLDPRRRRGPPFSQSITACQMTKVVQIAALPAIRSAWKPLQEFLRSVTARPFGRPN